MKTRILIALLGVIITSAFAQNDQVLATFNGKDITLNDFLIELNFLNQQQVQAVLQNTEARQQVVETIIRRRLLLEAANEAKIDTLTGTRILINRQVEDAILQVMLNQIGQTASQPNESEIKDFYENNDSVFYAPKSIRIQRIVVEDEETGKIVIAALKGGIEFESLIKKYPGFQDLPSGDIGYLPTDDLIPELQEKVVSLKVGAYSDPIMLNDIYQIFKVVDKREAGKLPLEDVELQIKNSLTQRKADLKIQEYQTKLWDDSDISVKADEIKALQLGNKNN